VLLAIVAIEPSWWTGGALVAWGAGWGLGRFRFPRRWTRPLLLFVIVPSIVAWLVAHAESATLDWKITLFVLIPLLTAAEGHALGLWLGIQIFAPDRVRHDAMDHAVEAQTSGVALSRILLVTLVLMTMQNEVVRTALVGIMITEAIGVAIPLPGWRPRST
ncbi:MAG: hypothetical protein KDA28_13790, partial [Phycisphaerales bacterium]|nr:hypothetical protein [Phycisphaerales bacterium]